MNVLFHVPYDYTRVQFNMPLVFRTADALDACFLWSTCYMFTWIDAITSFATVIVKFVSEFAFPVTVLLLTLENC